MKKFILLTLFCSSLTYANICGFQDTRVSSNEDRIGRMDITAVNLKTNIEENMSCTVTMVSKSCAITAGHCLNFKRPRFLVNFQVGKSTRDGKPVSSKREHRYYVEKKSISFDHQRTNGSIQHTTADWGVIKLKANKKTNLLPGEAYGYYPINSELVSLGTDISVTGYGMNSRFNKDSSKSFTQRTANGAIRSIFTIGPFKRISFHDVDTMQGASGAAIINSKSEVIGVHITGGCDDDGGNNSSSLLMQNPKLVEAIKTCIDSESL